MDVRKAIQSRRSIRAYESRDVEEDKLERVLESDYIMACGQPAYSIDTAIAVDHMTL